VGKSTLFGVDGRYLAATQSGILISTYRSLGAARGWVTLDGSGKSEMLGSYSDLRPSVGETEGELGREGMTRGMCFGRDLGGWLLGMGLRGAKNWLMRSVDWRSWESLLDEAFEGVDDLEDGQRSGDCWLAKAVGSDIVSWSVEKRKKECKKERKRAMGGCKTGKNAEGREIRPRERTSFVWGGRGESSARGGALDVVRSTSWFDGVELSLLV
jgi:hypothetical protein